MQKIILASGSPRRRELLTQIGMPFEVITSDVKEVTTATQPDKIVKELSKIKQKPWHKSVRKRENRTGMW